MRNLITLLLIGGLLSWGPVAWAEAQSSQQLQLTDTIKTTMTELPHLHGSTLEHGMLDEKVVVVTFFASWCIPCVKEFAYLKEVHAMFNDQGVEIVAINLFEDFDGLSNEKRLAAFIRRTQPPFSVVKGNSIVSEQFGKITRIPSLFIFDRGGESAFRFSNKRGAAQTSLNVEELTQVIAPLL